MAGEDARDYWNAQLKTWGLDTPEIQNLLTQTVTNSWSNEKLQTELFNTNSFKTAFPEYEASIRAGHPMDPASILEYRQNVKDVMFNAGLPPGFYDEPKDFADFIDKGLSAVEITHRVNESFARVKAAPQEVKDAFSSFFGANGDAALATFILDPTKGADIINQQVTQAEISGAGKRFGFDVNLTAAQRLGELGVDAGRTTQGFQQANELRPLSQETISETSDITNEGLISSVFGDKGTDQDAVQRRKLERAAAFGGGGGAAETKQGFGLGSSQ